MQQLLSALVPALPAAGPQRLSEQDPVTSLCGLGPTKAARLRDIGVMTLRDLMQYAGPAPKGVNIAQFKHLAAQHLVAPPPPPLPVAAPPFPTTERHSWFKLCGHALLKHGKTVRVEIGALMVAPYGCVLATTWRQGDKWNHRAITPLMLAATHVLWTQAAVVSEEEPEETNEELKETDEYRSASVDLPRFKVFEDEWKLGETQAHQLKLAVREVRTFQNHSVLALVDRKET